MLALQELCVCAYMHHFECSEADVIRNVAYGAVKQADTNLDRDYEVVSTPRPPSIPRPAQQPTTDETVYELLN